MKSVFSQVYRIFIKEIIHFIKLDNNENFCAYVIEKKDAVKIDLQKDFFLDSLAKLCVVELTNEFKEYRGHVTCKLEAIFSPISDTF